MVGHSFGSLIGLRFVAAYPELFEAYIGIGQLIDYNRSVLITYKWLRQQLIKAKDSLGLKRIESDSFPHIDLVVEYGGHHRLSIDLDSIIKKSSYFLGVFRLIK